ncbi:MAG TPA: RNA 2',3'-cyclic phosphodiesterase [Streptosporangiaceae bacterium]|jgi:2'-5' RNA ligase
MRLFIAVTPPQAALDDLESRLAPLRPAWPGLRWTSQAGWHLTLSFLGEVAEDRAAGLTEELAVAARLRRAVPMSVAAAGAFPRPSRAQVLWTGIQADQVSLTKLARAAARAARQAGTPPPGPRRRFQPHLTLARGTGRAPLDLRPLVDSLASYAGPRWTAARIELIRSHLGTAAPRYEQLGSWPLRPAPGPGEPKP